MATPYRAEFSAELEAEMRRLEAEGEKYEIVRGEIETMGKVQARHSWITRTLLRSLDRFVEDNQLGAVFHELNLLVEDDPKTIRIPDISYITNEQLASYPQEGWFRGAAALVIEVVSPGERAMALEAKISELFQAGTKAVWLVFDKKRHIHIYANPTACQILTESGTLANEELFPGWSIPVAEVFAQPGAATPRA